MKQSDDLLWLSAALDGELDIAQCAEWEARLASEPALKALWDTQQELRTAIREHVTYHEASPALRERIATLLAAQAPSPASARLVTNLPAASPASSALADPGRRRLWGLAAASLLLGAFAGAGTTWRMMRTGSQRRDEAEDAVAGHVRALLADRMVDVVSSDQHTVRPWISAHFAYGCPVPDLSGQGFELLGARRDVIGTQTVAVLAYRRRKHLISVFVHPSGNATNATGHAAVRLSEIRGFNVAEISHAGMGMQIVSDLNGRELADFAELFQRTA